MNWATALRLGRVSNLPTIWTNVLAGVVLSGATITPLSLAFLLLALSLFYLAGMYVNDAFDWEFDTVAYPQRPIPSGAVQVRTVFIIGFLGLTTGELLLIALGYGVEDGHGWPPALAGLCLAATIVYYNVNHKNNPYGPVLMGLCRAQVYLTTALAVAPTLPEHVWWGAGLLFAYIIGLSYIARQETLTQLTSLWPMAFLAAPFVYGIQAALHSIVPALIYVGLFAWVLYAVRRLMRRSQLDIREGVSKLIAGIALLDALLIALADEPWLAVAAVGGAILTRLAHRVIPGT
jgi:4-hydroxybenzoate polyprenyltransferase